MLENYLNQTAQLQRRTGTDQRGQPIFSEIQMINCRLQRKHTLIQNSNSEIVSAEHVCYLISEIKIGDKINNLTVLATDEWINLSGEIIGYKAVM